MNRRLISITTTIGALLVLGAGPAAAHSQTVSPPGQDGPVRDAVGVSQPWAQAHCNAAAPEVLAGTSSVATFSPAEALPCGDASDSHPAGRTHPHAG